MKIFGKSTLTLTLLALLGLGSLTGCTTVGDLMGNDTASINAQAAHSYQAMKAKSAIDSTSATAKRIHRVFNKMLPYADKANNTGVKFDWELIVIRNDTVNAWAMPGGKMAFYTGIVEKLNLTDAEIAAIMGHEMAHALEEHGKEKANFNLVKDIGLVGLSYTGIGVLGEIAMVSEYGGATAYSRAKEREADKVGLYLMAQAGYDPQASISFWQKMSAQEAPKTAIANKIDALLSTHPTDEARLQAMRDLQPEVLPIYQMALSGKANEFTVPVNLKKPVSEKIKSTLKKKK